MQQLSPQDAMFAYMETANTPLQLGWLNIYDPSTAPGGTVDLAAIVDHVARRLHTVRFFRQRLVYVPGNLDQPYWVEDEGFDLENHINYVALPGPGDWRQLCTLVARLFARPFDFTRPLWEFYVIEGLDQVEGYPAGSFAVLAKMHHAAIDGISGVDVTTFLHTPEPDAAPPAAQVWQPEPVPSKAELLLRASLSAISKPGRLIRTAANMAPGVKRVREAIKAGSMSKPERRKAPRTLFSGQVGPHRVMEARRFRIEDLRSIREVVPGATVNDVLLAIVGGAMRRYLLAKRALPDQTLIADCPISLRTEEERGQLGNRVANMTVPLSTDVADAVGRLRLIRDATRNAKGINEAIGAKTLSETSQFMPLMGRVMRLYGTLSLADRFGDVANAVVTNVPGPQTPLYLAGARLLSEFGLGTVLNGMGLFHFILSYCGELTLTVTADRDRLPDPEAYARCLEESYEELRAASLIGSPPPAPRKRKAKPVAASV